MSIEKDIKELTAAILTLASAVREAAANSVTVAVVPTEPPAELQQWLGSPPGTPAPESVREPEAPKPLTFEDVKAAFLGIAKAVGDPVKGAERSRAVLAQYGAAKMKDVEEAKWPAFVEDCRAAAGVV